MISLEGGGPDRSGSAFCINSSGIFVTNHHLINGATEVRLILNAGMQEEQWVEAEVIRSDAEADLAILAAKPDSKVVFQALELGDSGALYETMEIIAFGYPLGTSLSLDRGKSPNISVSAGQINSLRRKSGKLELIQLDAVVNPGNSGGPVIDREGKVIGVIVSGIFGSGINFAIPVSQLRTLLAEAYFDVSPPDVSYENLYGPVSLSAEFVPFLHGVAEPRVEYTVTHGARHISRILQDQGEGHYQGEAVLIEPTWSPKLKVRLVSDMGTSEVELENLQFAVGSRTIVMSSAASIFPTDSRVELRDGAKIEGDVSGLGARAISLGAVVSEIDLESLRRIDILQCPPISLAYEVSFFDGSELLKTIKGESNILGPQGVSASEAGPAQRDLANLPESIGSLSQGSGTKQRESSTLSRDGVRVRLPGMADQVVVAGGGKYWACWLKSLKSVALIDLRTAEIVRYIQVPTSNAIIAAGMSKLVVASLNDNLLLRYDLETGKRETTKQVPFSGAVKNMMMGSASEGPLVLITTDGTSALDRGGFRFLDLQSFKELSKEWSRDPHISYRDSIVPTINADGVILRVKMHHLFAG